MELSLNIIKAVVAVNKSSKSTICVSVLKNKITNILNIWKFTEKMIGTELLKESGMVLLPLFLLYSRNITYQLQLTDTAVQVIMGKLHLGNQKST